MSRAIHLRPVYELPFLVTQTELCCLKIYLYLCPLIHTRRAIMLVVQQMPNFDVRNYLPVHTASHSRRIVSHTDCCENLKSRFYDTSMPARGIQNPDTCTLVPRIMPRASRLLPLPLLSTLLLFSSAVNVQKSSQSLCPLQFPQQCARKVRTKWRGSTQHTDRVTTRPELQAVMSVLLVSNGV